MTNETKAPVEKRKRKKWMPLSEWVGNRPQRAVAAELDTTQALLWRVVSGLSVPTLETAAIIHARTKGRVPWWIHIPLERRQKIFGNKEGRP